MQTYNTLKKKLILGNEYSYPDLCRLIKEPIKTGGSKQKQLRVWKCHFDYEYNGSDKTYRITKLYSHPKEPENLRKKGIEGRYNKYIKPLIIDELIQNNNSISYTLNELIKILNMGNELFLSNIDNRALSESFGVDVDEIRSFLTHSKTRCSTIIQNVLRRMEKDKIIILNRKEYIITTETGSNLYRKATENEKEIIKSIKSRLLEQYHCETEYDIFRRNCDRGFYSSLSRELKKCWNIQKRFYKYEITYTGTKKSLLTPDEKADLRLKLNTTVVHSFSQSSKQLPVQKILIDKLIKVNDSMG